MESGAITQYIDVAQIVLYLFWAFFFSLVFWLNRESKREGYPVEPDTGNGTSFQGFPGVPSKKSFLLPDGSTVQVPRDKPEPEFRGRRVTPSNGSPYEPEGDPMLSALGPGAYANREDVPDAMFDGTPRIQPLRILTDYHVEGRDPNPIGMKVVGHDGVAGGTIVDVWADRAEHFLRYFEFEKNGGGRALVPATFTQIPLDRSCVKVNSVKGEHFANVPTLAKPDVVTLLEEDKIAAYYGGGHLFSDPSYREPLL